MMNQTAIDIEKEVTALEDQRLEAAVQGDLSLLEKLLSDDLTYVHTNSAIDTKAVFLNKLKQGNLKYLQYTLHGRKFKALSETVAIFSGRVEFKIISAGVAKDLNNIFIDVWAKRDGKWQLVSWQSTPIPAAAN
jgi:hypothetical protein